MEHPMEENLDLSDISDKDDAEELDLSPFVVNWLDFTVSGQLKKLGICSLPGCKYKETWRSLTFDMKCLKDIGVEDVFCLCTKRELHLFRSERLIKKYEKAGFTVHHHPIDDGQAPTIEALMKILEEIILCLSSDKKTIIHCYGGLGRSCLVAMCLSLFLDENVCLRDIQDKMKELRGVGAMGSVKQFNFVGDFREILKAYNLRTIKADRRASR